MQEKERCIFLLPFMFSFLILTLIPKLIPFYPSNKHFPSHPQFPKTSGFASPLVCDVWFILFITEMGVFTEACVEYSKHSVQDVCKNVSYLYGLSFYFQHLTLVDQGHIACNRITFCVIAVGTLTLNFVKFPHGVGVNTGPYVIFSHKMSNSRYLVSARRNLAITLLLLRIKMSIAWQLFVVYIPVVQTSSKPVQCL